MMTIWRFRAWNRISRHCVREFWLLDFFLVFISAIGWTQCGENADDMGVIKWCAVEIDPVCSEAVFLTH